MASQTIDLCPGSVVSTTNVTSTWPHITRRRGWRITPFCIQFLLFSLVSSVVVVKPFNVLEKFKEACKKILGLCLRITGEEVVNWHIELTEQEDDQADENEDNAAENDDYYKYELKLSALQNFTVTLIPGEHELDRICVARGRFRRWHLNCHCSSHSGDRFDE
jgi:hypothetical protein